MTSKLTKEFLDSKEFENLINQAPKIVKKYLTKGQYLTDVFPKKHIVIHHTSGSSMAGAWNWWNQTPERVGTPFIIDRDGIIYETFDPKMWAAHMGLKGSLYNLEKSSIGIELVAMGGLRKLAGKIGYFFLPLFPSLTSAKLVPESEVLNLSKSPYRGFEAFQRYTDEQIIGLCQLIGMLKSLFPMIKLENFDPKILNEFNPEAVIKEGKGLISHSTVRQDKSDTAPQPELLMALDKTCKLLTTKKK